MGVVKTERKRCNEESRQEVELIESNKELYKTVLEREELEARPENGVFETEDE